MVWAHGTTGVADKCAPSKTALNANVKDMIKKLLSSRLYGSRTDYEGLGEPIQMKLILS